MHGWTSAQLWFDRLASNRSRGSSFRLSYKDRPELANISTTSQTPTLDSLGTISFVKCIGGGNAVAENEINPQVRGCLLRNVCFDEDEQWTLYGWDRSLAESLTGEEAMRIGNNQPKSIRGYENFHKQILSFAFSADPAPMDELERVQDLTLLLVMTQHKENPGHVIFESLMPRWSTLMDILPELDIENLEINALVFQSVGSFQKKLMSDLFGTRVFKLEPGTCFDQLVIGGRKRGGLTGNMNAEAFHSFRKFMYSSYGIVERPPQAFKILILQKTWSGWGHNNGVKNWNEVREWIMELGFLDVTIVNPSTYSIREQVELFSQTVLVMSIWGGNCMMDFLQPDGAIEMIVGTWHIGQDYIPEEAKGVTCPDIDRGLHNSYAYVNTYRYCHVEGEANKGEVKFNLEKEKLMPLFRSMVLEICVNFPHFEECRGPDFQDLVDASLRDRIHSDITTMEPS